MNKEEILAMEAGSELNAIVAEKVMGWEKQKMLGTSFPEKFGWFEKEGRITYTARNNSTWSPSTDISAAWEVVEKLKLKLQIFTYFHDVEGFENGWCVKIDGKHAEGVEKAPEAICKAALLAVME